MQFSCSITRKLEDGEQLLVKNNVILGDSLEYLEEDIYSIIRQRPNKKILGVKLKLRLYNNSVGKPDTKFWGWWRKNLTEDPVLYDSLLAEESRLQIERYLFQKSYFNAQVTHGISTSGRKNKKLRSYFTLYPGKSYLINDFDYKIEDKALLPIWHRYIKGTKLEGKPYDFEKLEEIRLGLVKSIQEEGFFDFNKNFVSVKADTFSVPGKVNLSFLITKNQGLDHKKFKIGDIYVEPNYKFETQDSEKDTTYYKGLKIIHDGELNFTPRFLNQNILLDTDEYKLVNTDLSYRRLSGLNLFRNVLIDLKKDDSNKDEINARVYLTPAPKHSFNIESRLESRIASATNTNAETPALNFGVSGSFSYSLRNAFKNGEIIQLAFSGGLEPFFLSDSTTNTNFFNTIQYGPTASIIFPRFLLPINQSKFDKLKFPKTTISVGYNELKNSSIVRKSLNTSMAYEWRQNQRITHIVKPLDLSIVDADLSIGLKRSLESLGDPFLLNSYRDQLIAASSYTFLYNQVKYTPWRFSYRGKIESAGSALRGLMKTANFKTNEEGTYDVSGINFAHYLLTDHELRLGYKKNDKNAWAFRLNFGYGKTLKNNPSLPFEKSFFAGGAVGIRAWRARTLGPGSYIDTVNFAGVINQIGDIKLEANAEYRFKIWGVLHGALFTDAGNIWVLNEKGNRDNTQFRTEFYEDIAIGTGAGFRVDFDFLVVRLDVGLQFRDPGLPQGEKWLFQGKEEYNRAIDNYNANLTGENPSYINHYAPKYNFNIGIGYPF